jgi:hypothetical protein
MALVTRKMSPHKSSGIQLSFKFQLHAHVGARRLSVLMGPLWESNGQEVLHFLFAPSQSLTKATLLRARLLGTK